MLHVGINIGALSVKIVAIRGETRQGIVMAHQGRPRQVLEEFLAKADFADAEYFGVSGHLGHIPEVAAIQRALREVGGAFDAVASLGGESFLVYILAEGKVVNVLSHNKCAAGSGEFFLQHIGRMGLGMDDAIRLSFQGKVVPLASRCSVHCKSDITHKLNRHEATPADILHTLHDSMANKIVALLEQGQCELKRVLLIGGATRNAALVAALRAKYAAEFVVLPESPWFEAWGSALLARDAPRYKSPQIKRPPDIGSLPPLNRYADQVQVIADQPRMSPPTGPLVLGVDAGSTTTNNLARSRDSTWRGVARRALLIPTRVSSNSSFVSSSCPISSCSTPCPKTIISDSTPPCWRGIYRRRSSWRISLWKLIMSCASSVVPIVCSCFGTNGGGSPPRCVHSTSSLPSCPDSLIAWRRCRGRMIR